MQATQGQPPQYAFPVVQPNVAPPPRSNIRIGYKASSVRKLGTAQTVLGCLAFGFQLWDTINRSYMGDVGAGMWSGLYFITAGCSGIISAKQKTVCSIVVYMVMSILSSLLAISLLVISSINLDFYNQCNFYDGIWNYCYYISSYTIGCSIFLSTMLVLIAVAEGICGIVGASFACHGTCCSATTPDVPPVVYSTTQAQYVQTPNGQLLLVTGQQPQIMTTTVTQQPNLVIATPGQQVIVAGNHGNYQAQMGDPATFAAQRYTVPAITTQQPVTQPVPIQPPAYQAEQAVGTQPSEQQQNATNDKTSMDFPNNY